MRLSHQPGGQHLPHRQHHHRKVSGCQFSAHIIIVIIIKYFQAVCFPHSYSFRTRKIGVACLISIYILPSVSLAVALNVPRVLEISPLGAQLEENKHYLSFYMYYQVREGLKKKEKKLEFSNRGMGEGVQK